ncbi:MAG: YhcH/YjgK/YiaL family protein [Prevotella sp.]|nr:YhcH/YjgK/YiaL family protein [Prevotella sp.]
MIVDRIENLEKYFSLNPLFKEVAEFLKANDMNALETGIHKIKGDDVFVNIQEAKGKTAEQAVVEYHRQMVDIQIPFSGIETYGYIPVADLPEVEFNEAKDVALLPGVASQSYVTCRPGMFVIFFPQDGHAPFISDEPLLRKAIFKIKDNK